ncbi:MAG: hypothetical protein EOP07_08090 [Proteobacteria bacterium]|nr:MAG: hypothetical protein EOP07_08090 [Pseudomonadota bacterium]
MHLRKSVKDRALSSALKPWVFGLLAIFAMGAADAAFAQEASLYPSFSFDLNYGLTTMKSKLVESNDTGSALGYSLGGFAGSGKNIEFNLGFEKDVATFALNDSKISYDWQDTKIRYHYGYFYAGIVFSRLNLMATSAGTEIIDAAGSGYGGSLGFYAPVGRGGSLRIDVTQVNIAAMKNSIATEVSVPSRLDIDIGAAIDIWGKWLDFTFGYRMRTLSLETDAAYAESESSTYLGLRMSTTR